MRVGPCALRAWGKAAGRQRMTLRRVSLGVGANIYDKLVIAAAQLAMVPVLATRWGLELYGAWLLLATVPSFLAMSDLGFATAAGTRMTMAVAREDRDEAVRLFHSAWAMVLASTAAAGVLALAAVLLVPSGMLPDGRGFPAEEARLTLAILVGYALLALQASIFGAGFRCAGHYALGAFWSANTVLFESLAAIAVALSGGGPQQVAVALLISRGVALALQGLTLRARVPWLRIGLSRASRDEVRALVRPALAVMALPAGQASFLQGTVLALGAAAGAAAVPAFVAARTLSRIGLQVTQLVVHALMPEYSAAVARGDRRSQAVMLLATLGSAAAVLVPFALILALAGPTIVEAWTAGVVRPDAALMLVMALTVVLGGFWNPLSNLILAMNRQAGFSYPFLALALLTAPVSYFLALSLGETGPAVAIAAMDLLMCGLIIRLGRRLFVGRQELAAAARAILTRET